MSASTSSPSRWTLAPGPGRSAAAVDIAVYVAAAAALWMAEEALRAAGRFPWPGLFDGGPTLIASFFVVAAIVRWRGQRWSALGLVRPPRWWFVPVWGLAVIAANIAAQLSVVPLLGSLLEVPQPDLSRYDVVRGNLPLFLAATAGAMITGGFIEEFIYRGLMVDRIARILGGGKPGLIAGAILCGVPFGLVHFEWGIGGMFVTAVMGAVLGLMFLATRRNLWPLVAGHAALDLILMLQVYLGAFD